MLQPGDLLQNRYRIEDVIQAGGMSVVYRGIDTSLDTVVAIKEMQGSYTSEQHKFMAGEQFRIEGRMLAHLEHPNLPRVTNFFREGATCYLVMDFIEGESLERLFVREGVQPLGRVLAWAHELCGVLHYLHTLDPPIIFRDLKPGNIMLTKKGQIKLIDFGISKDGGGSATRDFIRGAGTPGYCPPEQYLAQSMHTDARSDIYALGATMYALLTGRTVPEACNRMFNDLPLEVRDVNPTVSREVEAMLQRMLALRQNERFASMMEVRTLIDEFLAADPKKTRVMPLEALSPDPGAGRAPDNGGVPDPPTAGRRVTVKPYPGAPFQAPKEHPP